MVFSIPTDTHKNKKNEGALILYNPCHDPSHGSFLLPHFVGMPDPRRDLRLKVLFEPNHIPLLRTAATLLRNQTLFTINNHRRRQLKERHSQEEDFESAGPLEENDYIRLENIRLLFGNKPSPKSNTSSKLHWLKELSFQVDAMNVYKNLIADSVEGAFGPEGLAAKLLSFLHHGLTLPVETLNIEVRDHIVNRLFSSEDFRVLQHIMEEVLTFDRVRNRSITQRKKWLYRIESLISLRHFTRIAFDTRFEKNSFSAHLMELSFFDLLNRPTRSEIGQIMANPMYLEKGEWDIKQRFERAINMLQREIKYFLDQDAVPEAQYAIEVAYEVIRRNAVEFQQIQKQLSNQNYPLLQFYGGLLYEYENLKISLAQLQGFLVGFNVGSVEGRKHFIQIIVMISEALNALFLPLHLHPRMSSGFTIIEPGIDPARDIIPLRDVLIFLRNKVFEHPLPWRRKKLAHLLDITKATTWKIFKSLIEEMKLVGDRIKHRVDFLGSILKGEGNWEGTLVSLFERYAHNTPLPKEPGTDYNAAKSLEQLERQHQWQAHPLPTFQALRRYFLYPSFHLPTVIETNPAAIIAQKNNILKKAEKLPKESLAHTWEELNECLEDLKIFMGPSLQRDRLLAKLSLNLASPLEAKRLINRFYQILRGLLENPSTINYREKINPCYTKAFHRFYLDLRNLRNFQTHDLWRQEDLNRLTNNMLRTVTFFEQAFGQKELPSKLPDTDPMKELRDGIKSNKLTPEVVRTYITLRELDVNYVDHKGLTLLHYAVRKGNQLVTHVLLKLGANPHWMNREGSTVLHVAVSQEQYNLAQLLLDFGALTDRGNNVLDIAMEALKGQKITSKQRNFITLLKQYDSTQRGDEADALHKAIRERDVRTVLQFLLQGRVPFLYDKKGQLPLVQAMDEWVPTRLSLKMSNFLLKNGAVIDQREFNGGQRALYYAAQDRDPRKAALLLSQHAHLNLPGIESPLSQAVYASTETLTILLKAGAQPNWVDSLGQSPLLALMNSHARDSYSKAVALLEAGADPNGCNEFGTVLHNTLEHNRSPEAAMVLLDKGAAPFVKGWGGLYANKTPIEVAKGRLTPLLDTWMATGGQVKIAQLQRFMSYLPWSNLWKKKLMSLYTGKASAFTAKNEVLTACDIEEEEAAYFSVAENNQALRVLGTTPENIAELILKQIKEVEELIRSNVIANSHDLIDFPLPSMSEKQKDHLRWCAVLIARIKKAIKIYRIACIEDYGLSPHLTNEQLTNHPALLPKFKEAFQKLLKQKEEVARILSQPFMQAGNEKLLREYLIDTVRSGCWLKAGKEGFSGVLQAYARLSGTELVRWNFTTEPGEWDLRLSDPAPSTGKMLHLLHKKDSKHGRYYILTPLKGIKLKLKSSEALSSTSISQPSPSVGSGTSAAPSGGSSAQTSAPILTQFKGAKTTPFAEERLKIHLATLNSLFDKSSTTGAGTDLKQKIEDEILKLQQLKSDHNLTLETILSHGKSLGEEAEAILGKTNPLYQRIKNVFNAATHASDIVTERPLSRALTPCGKPSPYQTVSPSVSQEETEEMFNVFGKVSLDDSFDEGSSKQLGWNCFDVAVGLPSDRKTLVELALGNVEAFRYLVAPEIAHAAAATAVYLNRVRAIEVENKEAVEARNARLLELFEIGSALKDSAAKVDLEMAVETLLSAPLSETEAKSRRELIALRSYCLPSDMQTEEVRNLVNDYFDAYEFMAEPVRQCNIALGRVEGALLSLRDLDTFFRNETNRTQYQNAYEQYIKQRNELFKPFEDRFRDYCSNPETFKNYVRQYYGNNQWFAFQRRAGEQQETSMVDVAARMLNRRIVIHSIEVGHPVIYSTMGEFPKDQDIHIDYLGNNHFQRSSPFFLEDTLKAKPFVSAFSKSESSPEIDLGNEPVVVTVPTNIGSRLGAVNTSGMDPTRSGLGLELSGSTPMSPLSPQSHQPLSNTPKEGKDATESSARASFSPGLPSASATFLPRFSTPQTTPTTASTLAGTEATVTRRDSFSKND